jgi:hypothetical protein
VITCPIQRVEWRIGVGSQRFVVLLFGGGAVGGGGMVLPVVIRPGRVVSSRYPEFWPEMEETYNNGLKWVPDQALLSLAGECLPPPLDFGIDPDAVASGDWKREVAQTCSCVWVVVAVMGRDVCCRCLE